MSYVMVIQDTTGTHSCVRITKQQCEERLARYLSFYGRPYHVHVFRVEGETTKQVGKLASDNTIEWNE